MCVYAAKPGQTLDPAWLEPTPLGTSPAKQGPSDLPPARGHWDRHRGLLALIPTFVLTPQVNTVRPMAAWAIFYSVISSGPGPAASQPLRIALRVGLPPSPSLQSPSGPALPLNLSR